jgi:1-deoxy-D-xylulose-5-phosphate synthase
LLQRAYDQIIHDVCLQKLPVVFAVDRAGLVGEDGPTHHGMFDMSFLQPVPNLVIMAPKDEDELRHMLATALAREDGPSVLRYPRGAGLGVPMEGSPVPLPIGVAEVLQKGEDVCLLAIGAMVKPALEVASLLARAGFSATVVNMRFLKPLPSETLAAVWQSHRLIATIEENSITGGLGSAVLEWASHTQPVQELPVVTIGIPDRFVEHATRQEQLAGIGLQSEQICNRLMEPLAQLESKRRAQDAS